MRSTVGRLVIGVAMVLATAACSAGGDASGTGTADPVVDAGTAGGRDKPTDARAQVDRETRDDRGAGDGASLPGVSFGSPTDGQGSDDKTPAGGPVGAADAGAVDKDDTAPP